MSKSLGNGIDPLDIIDSHGADAMRFTLCSMTTNTQDVRMPVESITLPDGRTRNTSAKFDIGRNFCNKLWNASRFVLMNLGDAPPWSDIAPHRNLADKWILSRLNATIRDATAALENFRFNELSEILYHFTWDEFCDWYVEIAKSRINAGEAGPKAILAHCIDSILRLLHPIAPFITEAIWHKLNEIAPVRGPGDERAEKLLVRARWPQADAAAIDKTAEADFILLADIIRQVRNIRRQHNVAPSKKLDVLIEAGRADLVGDNIELIRSQASLGEISVKSEPVTPPADAASVTSGGIKVYVLSVIDRDTEIARLTKQIETLEKGIRAIQSKLSNESFLKKAPPDVVIRERDRMVAMGVDLEAVQKSLEALK